MADTAFADTPEVRERLATVGITEFSQLQRLDDEDREQAVGMLTAPPASARLPDPMPIGRSEHVDKTPRVSPEAADALKLLSRGRGRGIEEGVHYKVRLPDLDPTEPNIVAPDPNFGLPPGEAVSEASRKALIMLRLRQQGLDETDEQFARRVAAAELGQESIDAEPGLESWDRFLVALFSDNEAEQQLAFEKFSDQSELAGAQMRLVGPDNDILVFSPTGDPGTFRAVNPPGLEPGDVAQFMGKEGIVLASEAAAAFASRGRTFSTQLRRGLTEVGTQGGAAALGHLVRQGMQTVAGTQLDDAGNQAAGTIQEGAFSIIGGSLFELAGVIPRLFPAAQAVGGLRQLPGAEKAEESAQRIGIQFGVGQVAASPLIQRISKQVSQISSRLRMFLDDQALAITEAAQALVDKKARDKLISRFGPAFDERVQALNNLVDRQFELTRISGLAAGRKLQQSVTRWWNVERATSARLHNLAASMPQSEFIPDLQTLHGAADEVLDPKRFPMLPTVDDTGHTQVLPGAIEQPLTRELAEPEREAVRVIQGETRRLADLVRRADYDAMSDADRIRFLNDVATELYDLTIPSPGDVIRQAQRDAIRLRGAVLDTIDEGLKSADPEAHRVWREARTHYKKLMDTREQIRVKEIFETEEPDVVVDMLIDDPRASRLDAIRTAISPKHWKVLQDRYITRLMDDPWSLNRKLDEVEPDVLRRLIPDSNRIKKLRTIATQFDALNDSGLREALRQQTKTGAFVTQLVETGNTGSISAMNRFVEGASEGARKGLEKSYKASIVDQIVTRSLVRADGVWVLNAQKFGGHLERYKASGAMDLFSEAEMRRLNDIELVGSFVRSTAGTGGGSVLFAASFASEMTEAAFEGRVIEASANLARWVGLGRVFTNPRWRRLASGPTPRGGLGPGERAISADTALSMAGAMIATATTDAEDQMTDAELDALMTYEGLK